MTWAEPPFRRERADCRSGRATKSQDCYGPNDQGALNHNFIATAMQIENLLHQIQTRPMASLFLLSRDSGHDPLNMRMICMLLSCTVAKSNIFPAKFPVSRENVCVDLLAGRPKADHW